MVRPYQKFSLATVCLTAMATFAQGAEFPCAGERCLPRSAAPAAAASAEPEDDPETAVAASAPVMFAAPTPSGEVQGARPSYLLPSLEFSIPSWQVGLPQVRLFGMGRNRREAHMKLDAGTAPMASGAPAVYGPLLGASLQQRAASAAPAKAADPAPATAAPASAAPAGCDNSCALREQQEEVRQLTQQVQQLQGLLLQVAEQQAAGQQQQASQVEEGTEQAEVETDQPPPRLSVVPKKPRAGATTRTVSTRTAKSVSIQDSEAATERLALLQQQLEEKQAEMEALQAQQEEIEAEERAEIAAEEKRLAARKKQLEAERESRLRNRVVRESSETETPVRRSATYEQANFETEESEEPEAPVPVAPKKLMKSAKPKAMPVSQSRWRAAGASDDE